MNISPEDKNKDMLFADGFGEALIGYVTRCGQQPTALYNRSKCIWILMERDGMSQEEAEEHFEYNVAGSYMGEFTPFFATLDEDLDEEGNMLSCGCRGLSHRIGCRFHQICL
tara:strand:+ start:78 stop:413 length:336 start_codon:yes stop_codon:yes gene_type:complete